MPLPSVIRAMPPPEIPRVLVAGGLAEATGLGLFLTVSALFFNRIVGLAAAQVGLGLGIAGIVGVLAGTPLGYLSDRFRPRTVLVCSLAVQSAGTLAYLVVHDFAGFLGVAVLVVLGERSAAAARSTVIATTVPATSRVTTRAYLRAIGNVGVSLGALGAAVALSVGTWGAYAVVIVVNTVMLGTAALVSTRLLDPPPRPRDATEKLPVLRDARYAAVALVSGGMCLHYAIFEIGVPLWISTRAGVPVTLVPVLVVVNTVAVILLQVRLSRGVDTAASGALAQRRAGVLFLVATVGYALAGAVPVVLAVLCLLAGTVVYTVGEMLQSSGSWALSFELAPADRQGQYQGLFGAAGSGGTMLGPLAVAATALTLGGAGWLLLGAVLATLGVASVPLTRWTERRPVAV